MKSITESPLALKRRARKMNRILAETYPYAVAELDFENPFELLVATVLSAQTTDVRVNSITPALFARYPDAEAMSQAERPELEELIRPTGFFRAKAESLLGLSTALVDQHDGQVPGKLAELVKLPGVGRKTANVVLNTAFRQFTMAVDTHIFRVSNRTGIAPGKNVLEVERKLIRFVPKDYLLDAHHWLILHGRYVCKARKPLCGSCRIEDLCEYRHKTSDD